ncbi:MAG: serine/threonine-protein kinase PknB [Acidimicrobiia bacterium]|nr:MAG: serine/threonine-protein kinase PknB [Acidimicrobiia bacterium]
MDTPTSLTDRYRIVSHLARGGMADVYRGYDELLGRNVAIKVLHQQLSNDEAFVKRFRKEAQAAANLTHPNIVGIYDWGQFDSTYFIVMELVEGRSLRDVLRSEGPLLPRRATEIAAEVAAALSVAHRAGLVHRDVKPGNILLAPDGTVKVTDFGIARAWDDSQELTRTGAVMGTATYFSPEQAQGGKVDERSDIYSLGVVLYEMLTGQPPFRGDSPVAVAYQHVSAEAPPPSRLNPDVPAELDAIVGKCLQKDPQARYQTAEELRTDLWRALQGEKPMAGAVPPPAAADDATRVLAVPPATVPPDEAYRQLEEPPSSNLGFIVGTFALLATLIVLVILTFDLFSGSGGGATLEVPNVVGMTEEEALVVLQRAGFIAVARERPDPTVEEGLVIETDPPAGTQAEEGSLVTVWVSSGEERFGVPFVIGMDLETARQRIEEQGFTVGQITERADPDEPEGTVLDQNPQPGAQVPAGTPIDLVVSAGPDTVEIPPIVGLTERDAVSQLQLAGLTWTIEREYSDEVEEGRVIRTDPEPGEQVAPDTRVLVVVSDGPEPVQVPNLFGLTEQQARSTLEGLGLVMEVSQARIEVSDPSLVDKVVQQNPQAGVTLERGSTVVVTLGAPAPTTTTTTTTTTSTTTTTTEPPPEP